MEPNIVVAAINLHIHPRYFIFDFPIVLHEWLSKLVTQKKKFQGREPREWNPQLIEEMEEVRNPMSRDVEF